MRYLVRILIGIMMALAALTPAVDAAPLEQAASCRFVLGFKTLHDLIPSIVGACVDNESHTANGDAVQHTTNGLLVWRKMDNYTAFTNGYRTWINGPFGLQERLNSSRFPWEKRASVAATAVVHFVPPASASHQTSGSCFASSIAATRTDAWRCSAGNVIYDPCFAVSGDQTAVTCVRDPLDPGSIVRLVLEKPLPPAETVPIQPRPWFLQLADGTVCNFFTGATAGINGERINYGCSDGWVIVGDVHPDGVWTAREVFLAPQSITPQESATVQIKTAWL